MTLEDILKKYECKGCQAFVKLAFDKSPHRKAILRGTMTTPHPIDAHNGHGGEFDSDGIVPDQGFPEK